MRRKFLNIIFGIILIVTYLPFSFVFTKTAYADFPCTISPATMSPNLTSTNPTVNFSINGNGNFASGSNQAYNIAVNGITIGESIRYGRPQQFFASNGQIQVNNFSVNNTGQYNIAVYLNGDTNNLCNNSPSFTVNGGSGSGGSTCSLVPVPTPFNPKPSTYVAFKINGQLATTGNGDDTLHVYIKTNNDSGASVWDGCVKRSNLASENGFGFGYLTSGTYYIQVNDKCGSFPFFWNGEHQACYATFNVNPTGGGLNSSGNPQNPAPPGPCANGANVGGKCTVVDTALGPIGTDPASLIESLFGIILSLSGGIALLLIIVSGYKLMTSQGNPEGIKGAREQLTAAIVGLLFIIFAIVILQIIGVNILHIPGFAAGGGGGGQW